MTNSVGYNFSERGESSDKYAWRLFVFNATNNIQCEARDAGICFRKFSDYFISVTNQLLSSGQPLPWINVGTGGN